MRSAEKLLGKGDMLYQPLARPNPSAQGLLVTRSSIVDFIAEQGADEMEIHQQLSNPPPYGCRAQR